MKTIRSRLIIIFMVCFSFTGGLTILYYYNILFLEQKMMLIEEFDNFKEQILELRRYEKNYFLTNNSSHLEQMADYLSKTEDSFVKLEDEMKGILNSAEYDIVAAALKDYRKILDHSSSTSAEGNLVMEELQSHGRTVTIFSEKLITKKRERLKRALRQLLFVPLTLTVGFIFIAVFVTSMIRKDVLKPLSLIHESVVNASKGIFLPIPNASQKKNEVSQCIEAFNNMVVKIDSSQEQLLHSRKMASIGTFTSGIAHELNNPINNISLIVESLIDDQDSLSTEERLELYNDLMNQTERSSEIVRDLLEFSRTDQGQFSTISLADMIEKTERLLANELKYTGINFHVHIQENLPKLRIDKSRLQQALVNLLINGIQAMPDGGDLTLTIESDPVNEHIRINVQDTGGGMDKDQLDKIFDPFFTTKKEGEGTGLGLSVTYNIIKQHNGRISVESTRDKGTCFSIFLPVKA
jgi:two-component system NtrC family sensor kinase